MRVLVVSAGTGLNARRPSHNVEVGGAVPSTEAALRRLRPANPRGRDSSSGRAT